MLLISCCIFYLFLGTYIYKIYSKSRINKVFLQLSICCVLWAGGYAAMLVCTEMSLAIFCQRIAALGYTFFITYWVYFAYLINNENPKKYENLVRALVIIPVIAFIIVEIFVDPSKTIRREYYGWIDVFEMTTYQNIYNLIIVVFFVAGIIILYLRGKYSKKNRVKQQIRVIVITSIITFVLGIMTDIILPMFNIILFPSAIITGVIEMIGIYYAISKHKMMSITPKFISEYIFNTANEPIFILNKDFIIQSCNLASLSITGYSNGELDKSDFKLLINTIGFNINNIMKSRKLKNIEVELRRKGKDGLACELSGTIIYDDYYDILGIIVLIHDVSERKKIEEIEKSYTLKLEETNLKLKNQIQDKIHAEKKMRHFVYYDVLTKLPNRKKILEIIDNLVGNKEERFAVLFIDLDGFKSINDNFGHQVGDSVLQSISRKFQDIIGENDAISRIGGDEFIIVLEKLYDNLYIEKIAEKIRQSLKQPIKYQGKNLFVGASIGISVFPDNGLDSDTLIKQADIAMYEAKKNGGYSYIRYSPEMDDKVIDKLSTKIKFNKAMANNEFRVYYQPIMDLRSNKIVNSEALIRWKQEEKIILPIEFIKMAKSVGEILTIDNWMLENSCIQCRKWHELGAKEFSVSVNTSYTQLKQSNFVLMVERILKRYSLEANFLTLEITEDEAMEEPEEIIKILTKLKSIGVQISMDDFGTGYSSFSYINKLPIDKIKIDRSLIADLGEGYKNTMIVKSIIMMGHSLGVEIVAEGIETEEQFAILKELECDYIQGYLIGKPMENVAFEEQFINISYTRENRQVN